MCPTFDPCRGPISNLQCVSWEHYQPSYKHISYVWIGTTQGYINTPYIMYQQATTIMLWIENIIFQSWQITKFYKKCLPFFFGWEMKTIILFFPYVLQLILHNLSPAIFQELNYHVNCWSTLCMCAHTRACTHTYARTNCLINKYLWQLTNIHTHNHI